MAWRVRSSSVSLHTFSHELTPSVLCEGSWKRRPRGSSEPRLGNTSRLDGVQPHAGDPRVCFLVRLVEGPWRRPACEPACDQDHASSRQAGRGQQEEEVNPSSIRLDAEARVDLGGGGQGGRPGGGRARKEKTRTARGKYYRRALCCAARLSGGAWMPPSHFGPAVRTEFGRGRGRPSSAP